MKLKTSKAARLFVLCAAMILTLPALYALSYGPIQFLDEREALAPAVVATLHPLYRPLGRVVASPSVAGKALRAYMRLWTKGHFFDEQARDSEIPPPATNASASASAPQPLTQTQPRNQ